MSQLYLYAKLMVNDTWNFLHRTAGLSDFTKGDTADAYLTDSLSPTRRENL